MTHRAVAMAALGAALVLAGAGCGGSASAFGRYRILLVGQAGDGQERILLWRPGSRVDPFTGPTDGYEGGGDFLSAMSDGVLSPDGRSIAYEQDYSGGLAPPTPTIDVMRSDGTHVKLLVSDEGDSEAVTDGPPSWSPDGRRLVYEQQINHWETDANTQDFVIVDVRTGKERILSAGSRAAGDPVWGRAGIAYASGSGIMLLDPSTGRSRLLARKVVSSMLAWSPGGVLAAVEPTQIVLLAASGRVLGRLPTPTRGVCAIDWSPNPGQILAATSTPNEDVELWVGTESTKRWQRFPPVPKWRKDTYECAVGWR